MIPLPAGNDMQQHQWSHTVVKRDEIIKTTYSSIKIYSKILPWNKSSVAQYLSARTQMWDGTEFKCHFLKMSSSDSNMGSQL